MVGEVQGLTGLSFNTQEQFKSVPKNHGDRVAIADPIWQTQGDFIKEPYSFSGTQTSVERQCNQTMTMPFGSLTAMPRLIKT